MCASWARSMDRVGTICVCFLDKVYGQSRHYMCFLDKVYGQGRRYLCVLPFVPREEL